MNKNKWILIGLGVAAVIAYDFYVIKPYNQKYQKHLAEQKKTEKPAVDYGQGATPATTTASTPTAEKTSALSTGESATSWNLGADKKIELVSTSSKRQVGFFADGRIGNAIFSDYIVRGSKEKIPVVVQENGFRWITNDVAVQQCLNSLSLSVVGGKTPAVFSATTSAGSCRIEYDIDAQKAGVINSKLSLNGFNGSAGELFFSGTGDPNTGLAQDHHFLTVSVAESVTHIREKDLFKETKLEGKIDWLMWGDRYFSATLLPKGEWNPTVFHKDPAGGENKIVEYGFRYPLVFKAGQASFENQIYFSTRDSDSLIVASPTLPNAVDLGFFGSIANLLLMALRFINNFVNNYGVSIVVLTLLVRLMFWPLNKKVFASGQRMKQVQPEVEKIKLKYGNDKSKAQEMQLEIWNVYKKNNVNPMGSCLPLLLQMPIFFALYGALNHSLDLYQAPFVGWITDLSSPDSFYIFPILWTLSLLAYLKINPTQPTQPGAPDMKWIMIGMNIFIGYLSKDWPSGLTLYLFVSNLVGILQQVMMLRSGKKLLPVQEGV